MHQHHLLKERDDSNFVKHDAELQSTRPKITQNRQSTSLSEDTFNNAKSHNKMLDEAHLSNHCSEEIAAGNRNSTSTQPATESASHSKHMVAVDPCMFPGENEKKGRKHVVFKNDTQQCEGTAQRHVQNEAANNMEQSSDSDSEASHLTENDKGKIEYAKGNCKAATQHWLNGLRTLQYILSKDVGDDSKRSFFQEQECILNSNLALVSLKCQKWRDAISYCDAVLKVVPDHSKSLYRKAQAHFKTLDYILAEQAVLKFLRKSPNHVAARKLLQAIVESKAAYKLMEKKTYEKMFQSIEHDPRTLNASKSSLLQSLWWKASDSLSRASNTIFNLCKRRKSRKSL